MSTVGQNMEPENGQRSGSDTLLVLQPKSFRSFNNKDEYLYAMKEDLADWFTCLYKIEINGDIFFEVIETGILLCKHANEVINFTKERREKGIEIIMKSYFVTHIPENLIQYKENNVKPGSFLARDNISNFISWCRILGIPDDLRFETEDLVTRKNEKSVILCLLEVARVGAKLGMLAPTIVQMEEEIDAELAGEPPPQIITCDLKSLDEMVRLLVGYCTCPVQFAMVKVGDGKYQVGESKTLIFVRILRKHVMVRVGGGWDTLERYLDKHDPCRCNVHRGSGQNGISASQKIPPRRMSAPNGSAPSPINTPRRMSSTNSSVNSRSQSANSGRKSPGPGYRSKSPSPGVQRVSQLSTIPQHDETSQDSPRSQLSRRSLSPTPTRSHSPGPRSIPTPVKSRTLPQPPGQRTIMARRPSAGTVSLSPNKTNSNNTTRSSTPKGILNKAPRRQTSIDSQESDNMEMENGDKVSMDEITTMTLEDFKNLLNSSLAPSGAISQSSESPRSQESADSYRNQTKSIVRHGTDSEKGPSWKSVREKTRNVCDSMTKKNYQRNVNNNRDTTDSHNVENSRPKTPTSNWRPKTPTSGVKSKYAHSHTPTSRPKTPSRDNSNSSTSRPSPARSNEEDLSNRYVRSRTPSKASSFSSLDDDESSELAFINNCAASRSSKESSPAESIEKLMMPVDLRSRTPGISGIPRPSTPSGIPKAVSASNSTPSTPKMIRKKSLTETSIAGQNSGAISRPPGMSERTYSSIYQTRRSKTPGPISEKSQIPGPNRSITPGPREAWNKSQLPRQNSKDGERRNSRVSRSLDFSRQRSKSVVDISNNNDSEGQCTTPTNDDVTSEESRSRLKNKIMAMNEKRRRSTSSGPKTLSKTESGDENQLLMITRGKGGGHSVTVENKGATTYQSNKTSTPKSYLANGHAEKFRQRSKTPDPSMYNGRTRLIDPKLSARRNSSGTSTVDKRLEAWVDSTVSQTKRKVPFRSKRSMTPNSVEFTDEDLAPRPMEEIKAALEKPMNGVVRPVEELPPPPEDPEMYMKMEKLFAKYREMELQASDSQTPEMCSLDVDVDVGDEMCTNESASVSVKSNSSPSAHSYNYSWTNSGSSRSSGSPAPAVSTLKIGSIPSKSLSISSHGNQAQVEQNDLCSSAALVSKMKEVLKVRPRNEPKSGPRTRIPAPSFKARPNQRSKSITDLNTNCDYSLSNDSKTEFDSAYEHSVHDNSEHSDEISELSQMTTKFCEDSAFELSRSETPVPKLATPLTTGRSTVISTNNNNNSSRLVRGTSQEPVDHSRSNSLSSLSSRLSMSNADEMEYV